MPTSTAMARAGADAILLPKVEGSDTVRRALHVLDLAGAPASLAIWCMIETPRGILHAEEIADTERVQCIVMGTSDLTKDLQAHPHPRTAADAGVARHLPARGPRRPDLDPRRRASRSRRRGRLRRSPATRAAISASTARTLIHPRQIAPGQRGLRSGRRPRSPGRAGSSRPTTRRGPPARASWWSTASWSRTCTCSRRAGWWRWPR